MLYALDEYGRVWWLDPRHDIDMTGPGWTQLTNRRMPEGGRDMTRHPWAKRTEDSETCPRCGISRQRRSGHSLYFDADGRLVGFRAPPCAMRVDRLPDNSETVD